MNVAPGCLARVVAPFVAPGRGAIVVVVRPAQNYEKFGRHEFVRNISAWVCEGRVRYEDGQVVGPLVVIGDECLRRIDPPADAIDEVVARVGPAPDVRSVEGVEA